MIVLYRAGGGQERQTLGIFGLHGFEAGLAGGESGGVHCRHGAALLYASGAVSQGGDGGNGTRVAEKIICISINHS